MITYRIKKLHKNWLKIFIIVLVFMVVLATGAVVGVRRIYDDNLKPLNSNQGSVSVVIPIGSSLREVAAILKNQKIIKSSWAFERYVRNKDASDKIKAGTYELSPSLGVSEIVSMITEGKVATNLFTIIPGKRLDEVKKAFIVAGYSQQVVDNAFNPELYKDHQALVDKPASANLEGYLYPDSYQKTASTKPETIIRQSLDEMQKHLTPEIRTAMASHGYSVHQGITLASIAQREADKPEDRSQVVQVLLTRLQKGMRLESDPTAFYGAFLAGQAPSLAYDSPYNTYLHNGLPPGPISNVSDSSLKAVAYPANTDYLFFVAGDDGTVYFSKTLQEHQAKANQYCHKKCGR